MIISILTCENNVILLGINIDCMLKFDDHVADIRMQGRLQNN